MIALQATATGLGFGSVVLAGSDPLDHVKPHNLFHGTNTFLDSITNHIFMLGLSGILLLILIPLAARKKALVPSGWRNCLEAVLQFIREDVARPALGKHTDRFIPFLWTMFLLILMANLLGLVPLGPVLSAASMDRHLEHWGGTATGNLGITAGLALCAFVLFHVSGVRAMGFMPYMKHTFVGHGPVALAPLFIPIEIIGTFVKPFALAMRLFANMIGGHIVVAVLLIFAVQGVEAGIAGTFGTFGSVGMFLVTLVCIVGAVAITLLELFVAFLQAYIFTFLTTLFLGAAIHPEH